LKFQPDAGQELEAESLYLVSQWPFLSGEVDLDKQNPESRYLEIAFMSNPMLHELEMGQVYETLLKSGQKPPKLRNLVDSHKGSQSRTKTFGARSRMSQGQGRPVFAI
jgi:hypothetical protein